MAWFDTIASVLGPVGASTALAGAIYAGSAALEKNMRKEALQDIAKFINNEAHLPDTLVVADFIYRTFEIVFGRRHLSWKCFRRSMLVSFICVISMFASYFFTHPVYGRYWVDNLKPIEDLGVSLPLAIFLAAFATVISIFLNSVIPDYLSLWKGRILLQRMMVRTTLMKMCRIVFVDVVISFSISAITIIAINYLYVLILIRSEALSVKVASAIIKSLFVNTVDFFIYGQTVVWSDTHQIPLIIMVFLTVLSTLLTSAWTILVIISCILLKCLSSMSWLMRVIRWMFDVEQHPVKVLGMSAVLVVWTSSIIYAAI